MACADAGNAVQNMWNRNNGTAQEAFALRFIFTAPDHREVGFRSSLLFSTLRNPLALLAYQCGRVERRLQVCLGICQIRRLGLPCSS